MTRHLHAQSSKQLLSDSKSGDSHVIISCNVHAHNWGTLLSTTITTVVYQQYAHIIEYGYTGQSVNQTWNPYRLCLTWWLTKLPVLITIFLAQNGVVWEMKQIICNSSLIFFLISLLLSLSLTHTLSLSRILVSLNSPLSPLSFSPFPLL